MADDNDKRTTPRTAPTKKRRPVAKKPTAKKTAADKSAAKKPAAARKATAKKGAASKKPTEKEPAAAEEPRSAEAASGVGLEAEPNPDPLNICFVAAEVTPFAKTGGLADVSAALPAYLASVGHDVRIFMPLYSTLKLSGGSIAPVDFLHHVPLTMGGHRFYFSVFVTKLPDSDVDVYLIGCPQLYEREGIYTGQWDDHLRFAFLSRAALECCQRMGWSPHVVHANDWHTALLPIYLKTLYSWDSLFARTRTVLTIHNIAYQGKFPADVLGNLGLDEHRGLLFQQDLDNGLINYLKTGILYADAVTTVSRTYAREIQSEAFGEGLEHLLRQRRESVVGIVNGVDYGVWSPERDPHLAENYGPETVDDGKAANKRALLAEVGLPDDDLQVPVIGVVSRLTAQKGFELTMEAMPQALRYLDVRYVVLGSGESHLEDHFHWLQRNFPHRMAFHCGYSDPLAHRIEAGADIFLMPSRFEPCGLNQMYSLKYGTVPIVRRTGGLADTVEQWDPETGDGTGFLFDHYDSNGFTWALKTALMVYRDRRAWQRLRANGMRQDYSWQRQGRQYEQLYRVLSRG